MKILVTGSHGLVGSALIARLGSSGHQIARLVRTKPASQPSEFFWNPAENQIDSASVEGFGAVVHLAGENLAARRWTAEQKRRIRDSRVNSTALLARTISKLQNRPKVLLCASAVGFYGNRDDELLTEASAPGTGFLADLCREWEAAAQPASEVGVRVAHLRFGVILSSRGGALAKMLPIFRFGLGGPIGSGRQYWSWVAIEDVLGVIELALNGGELSGPINVVAPGQVTNEQFTKALGQVLHRPTFFRVPAFATRLAFGEMADEALLASTRVKPTKLLQVGFEFKHAQLERALECLVEDLR